MVGVIGGTPSAYVEPVPTPMSKLASFGPAHDHVWFDRVHVIPRRKDLGAVVSEQRFEVEVWNAFLTRAKTLTDISIEGPAGISVTDHLGLPAHFAGTQSELYEVVVSAEGDPNINNLITWAFTGIDPLGTNLLVLGFRLVPMPFDVNLASDIQESYGYLTNLIESYSGSEQRRQLRAVPVGSIGFEILLHNVRDVQLAQSLLFGNQARAWGVPRPWAQRTLDQAAVLDDDEIYFDTTNLPYFVGGLVYMRLDAYTWEAHSIEEIFADHLKLTSGVRRSWAANTTVVQPMVIGRLSQNESFTWEDLAIGSQEFLFDIDGFTP